MFTGQLIDKPTRYREGQSSNILDLLLCNNEDLMSEVEYGDHLYSSDHIQLFALCECNIEKSTSLVEKRKFYKRDYEQAREDFKNVDCR